VRVIGNASLIAVGILAAIPTVGMAASWPIWLPFLIVFGLAINYKPLREIYKKYWLPLHFKLNKLLGGRAFAGRWVRRAQRIRLGGNTITTVAIIFLFAMAISITTFFSMGAAFPIWAVVLMSFGAGANMFALPIGAASNTVKAQCPYEHEERLRKLNNMKAGLTAETPHGIFTSHAEQRNMLLARYAHDGNGAGGTVMTGLDILAFFGASVAGPIPSASMFFASRASALISASGAPFTYKKRLNVHYNNIKNQVFEYYWHCARIKPDTHARINHLLNKTFAQRALKDNKYALWLRFECYCALERVIDENINVNENVLIANINEILDTVCKTKEGENSVSRKRLYTILGAKAKPTSLSYSEKIRALFNAGNQLAPLDAMPIFQEQLYQKIKLQTAYSKQFPSNLLEQFAPQQGAYPEVFLTHLKSAYLTKNGNLNELTPENLKRLARMSKDCIQIKDGLLHFNDEKLTQHFGMDTAHDKQFSPHCMKFLAESLIDDPPIQAAPSEKTTPSDKDLAESIWLDVFKMVQSNGEEREYDTYDDHDILFHMVMACIVANLTQKLAQCAVEDKEKKKSELTAALNIFAKTITEDSLIRKTLRNISEKATAVETFMGNLGADPTVQKPLLIAKPELPYQYFSPDKIKKNASDWTLTKDNGTPELNLAEQATHYFDTCCTRSLCA